VSGDAGVGKSRLIQRFASHVRELGGSVLFGHGSSEPGAPMLWPWIEVLQGILRSSAPLQRDITPLLQAFGPWLPNTPTRPQPNHSVPSTSITSQFRLHNMLVQVVLDLARSAPLCLIIEDLHELDLSSLCVLRQLQRQNTGQHLLLLCSTRLIDQPGDRGRVLREVLASFANRLPLSGLPVSEVHLLIEHSLSRPIAGELAGAVHALTEGNPLHVQTILATLQLSAAGDPLALPHSLRIAGERQLECLSSLCRQVLRFAAVLGREFSAELLACCLDQPADAQLDEACRLGVLQRWLADGNDYRFANMLLHEALLHELADAERAQAHARAAQVLLATCQTDQASVQCRAARHWLAEGGPTSLATAVELGERAGQAARERGAHAEEAAAREIVVEALHVLLGAKQQVQYALATQLIALGGALWRGGQIDQALLRYGEAAQIAQALRDHNLLAHAVLGSLGDYAAGLTQEQLAACELACAHSVDCPIELRVRLLARLGRELCFGTTSERGRALIAEALRLGKGNSDPAVQFALLKAQMHTQEGASPRARRGFAERRALLAQQLDDSAEAGWAEGELTCCAIELADLTQAEAHYGRLVVLAQRVGEPLFVHANIKGAMLALLRGEWQQAAQLLRDTESSGRKVPSIHMACWIQRSTLHLLQGETELALSLRKRIVALSDRPGMRAALALSYLHSGRVPEARLELRRALAGAEKPLVALCLLAELAHRLDETDLAEQLYSQLSAYDADCVLTPGGVLCLGALARYAGLAALTAGRHDRGIELLHEAIAINRRTGALPWLALSEYELAIALDSSAATEAVVHAREACQLASALGMKPLHALAESLSAERAAAPQVQPKSSEREFLQRGEYWLLTYQGQSAYLSDMKGMHYIEAMLAAPGHAKHVTELIAQVDKPCFTDAPAPEDGLPQGRLEGFERTLDAASIASYRVRMRELVEELHEAEAMHDLARTDRLRAELELLERELQQGAKPRQRTTERARKAVYNRIAKAIEHIERAHPKLAGHLTRHIDTGAHCVYRSDDGLRWVTGLAA